jgi:3-hydroxyacyl-CoA dehydrogenase
MHTSELVRVEREAEIALVIAHHPPVNTITAEVRTGLRGALDRIGQTHDFEAVLLLCEGSTFFSGADIGEFSGPPKEQEYHALFGAFENLAVPVVAAMHGTVLGGGLEIALACHYRIALESARFGMPEVTLGIIPGAGGTQRMPRLIGAEKALDLILSARPVDAPQARELGLLDEIVDTDLRANAVRFARALVSAGKGPRRTSAMSVDQASATDAVFATMAQRAQKQYPNRTAGLVAVEAVRAATTLPFEAGLEQETKFVNECKQREESKGAVHVFFAERATRRIPDVPDDIDARPVRSAGIVGAGTMGTGIAICFANAGIPVTLVDETSEALQRGRSSIAHVYQTMLDRGRITADEKTRRLNLIHLSLEYQDLREADLIIEAVF